MCRLHFDCVKITQKALDDPGSFIEFEASSHGVRCECCRGFPLTTDIALIESSPESLKVSPTLALRNEIWPVKLRLGRLLCFRLRYRFLVRPIVMCDAAADATISSEWTAHGQAGAGVGFRGRLGQGGGG